MLTSEEARYLSGEENPEEMVDVTVTVCFHKTVQIPVTDYRIVDEGIDEDGIYFRESDYSNCDLSPAIETVWDELKYMKEKGWEEDECETTLDG